MSRTYREIIGEIVPTEAITEAERRVYNRTNVTGAHYMCRDGKCALGVMHLLAHPHRMFHRNFPVPFDFPGAHEDESPTVRRRHRALTTIYRANDRGLLAAPGSLTTLLDREMKVVIR